jgi:hypothetical protein
VVSWPKQAAIPVQNITQNTNAVFRRDMSYPPLH